jgi:hypothetical protein
VVGQAADTCFHVDVLVADLTVTSSIERAATPTIRKQSNDRHIRQIDDDADVADKICDRPTVNGNAI